MFDTQQISTQKGIYNIGPKFHWQPERFSIGTSEVVHTLFQVLHSMCISEHHVYLMPSMYMHQLLIYSFVS